MPSLADIPDRYIDNMDTPGFLKWLRESPGDHPTRAKLARLFQLETGLPLTAADHASYKPPAPK